MAKAAAVYSKQLKLMHDKLTGWSDAERDVADPTKNETPNRHPAMPAYLDALLSSYGEMCATSLVSENKSMLYRSCSRSSGYIPCQYFYCSLPCNALLPHHNRLY